MANAIEVLFDARRIQTNTFFGCLFDSFSSPFVDPYFGCRVSLREVNALKISTSDTDIGGISALGTDLVGTSFQCHSHGTVFQ